MRALDRYIIRQLAAPCGAIAAALVLVMLLERAQRLLQEMAMTGMQARYFLPMLAWQAPYYLAQAIPAAFAATLIIVVARMATDHEWETMAAAGIPPRRMAWPMTLLAALLAALTLIIGGWLEPIGRHGYRTLHDVAVSESRIRALQPRAVYVPEPEIMLSAQSSGPDGLHGFFLWLANANGKETVVAARLARIATHDASRALEFRLTDGTMLTGRDQELRFGTMRLLQPFDMADPHRRRGRDARELTLAELLRQNPAALDGKGRDKRLAEIYVRLARALGILILPWIILPLLLASRARKRWPAIGIIALLVIALYHSVNLCRNLIANGRADLSWIAAFSIGLPVAISLAVWGLSGGQRAHSPLQWLADHPLLNRAPRTAAKRTRLSRRMGLTAYLALNIASMTSVVLVILVSLFQIIDLVDNGEILIRENLGWSGFAFYTWSQLPARLLQAAPPAMLGGTLLALDRMRSANELYAIHGFGVPVMGVVRRGVIVPVLMGLAMIGVAEFWAPRTDMAFLPWWETVSARDTGEQPEAPRWFRLPQEIVQATVVNSPHTVLTHPRIYRLDPEGLLVDRIDAGRAVWTGSKWVLEQASVRHFGRPQSSSEAAAPIVRLDWTNRVSPSQLHEFFAAPIPLSGRAALGALRETLPRDKANAFYRTRILMNLSTLLAPVVMFILVASLVVSPRRETRSAKLLFQSVVAGLSFLVANGYALVLGQAGQLASWAAVLAAPAAFLALGLARALRSDVDG